MNLTTKRFLFGIAAIGAGVLVRSASRARFSFRDKSVFITGASRGLGFVLARLFALEGSRLTLVSRSAETLEFAKHKLIALGARESNILTVVCDVRDRKQAESAIDEAIRYHGSVDVLVNNAGVIQVGPFEHMTLSDFEDAMATHAWGPLYLMNAAIPHMRSHGGGRIVNISSIGGRVAVPHLAPYVMSKFALSGLSDALRAELARDGILITSVSPGLMRTGSHVNAKFKGDHEREYVWFSTMSGVPVFSINGDRAARQIVEACRNRRPELTITVQARIAELANALFPSLFARGMRLMNAVLPGTGAADGMNSQSGWESMSAWSPSILTPLADEAIDVNNEHKAIA
jgi:NAD(P)-dependent dehydrogenase (short-subunit alcohol dehydrogenase family)